MTVEETIDKLMKLRLPHMAAALRATLDRAAGNTLGVEERRGRYRSTIFGGGATVDYP